MQSIPDNNRPYYLKPGERVTVPLTLVKRFDDENDLEQFHYEAWAKRNEDSEDVDCLIVYLSNRLDKETIEDSWNHFKRLWKDPNYRKHHLKNETIH